MINTLVLLMAFGGDAEAKKRKEGEGVPISVKVVDQADKDPVATAMIRHPKDVETYRVNEVTGIWQDSQIYMPDGSILHFTPGSTLRLEISAPGYVTQLVQYDIRRWRNKLEITLEKMELDDKDIETILNLLPKIGFFYWCKPNIGRALDANQLMKLGAKNDCIGLAFPSVKEAKKSALENAKENDLVFIGGSTFVVADAL